MAKYLSILCACCFLYSPIQAQTWVPEELYTFGSSIVNADDPGDPIKAE